MFKTDSKLLSAKLIFKYSPVKFFCEIILAAIKNIMIVLNSVWLLNYIVSLLMTAEDNFHNITNVMALFMILNISVGIVSSTYTNIFMPKLDLSAKRKLDKKLMEVADNLTLKCYENKDFYTIVSQAKHCANNTLFYAFSSTTQIFGYCVALISAALVIVQINPVLLLFVVFVFPITFINKHVANITAQQTLELADSERMRSHAQDTFLSKNKIRQFKTSTAYRISEKYYLNAYFNGLGIRKKYSKKIFVWDLLSRLFSSTLIIVLSYSYGFICFFTSDNFSVAGISVIFVAIMNMISRINKIIKSYSNLVKLKVEISSLEKFLNLEKETFDDNEIIPGTFESLEFKNVYFSYKDKNVLKNVSFKIKAGNFVSVVGYNGAGKTTMIKLINRFYDVDDGQILYNDIDIRNYELEAYRKKIANIFQDFFIFDLSIADNVAMSEERNMISIQKSLNNADADDLFAMSNKKINKTLYTDGVILSGGLSQKLAIARALYQKHDILILDELDSALDPISAKKILDEIRRDKGKNTTIVISHHLSTTRNADLILMLDDGKLIERGTHCELMNIKGKYATLFKSQAAAYSK